MLQESPLWSLLYSEGECDERAKGGGGQCDGSATQGDMVMILRMEIIQDRDGDVALLTLSNIGNHI